MTPLPVGTVTFMLTDIVGSTRLWEQSPAKMRATCARHDELIEALVGEHAGVLVRPRGEGDSRFAVFARATEAVAAGCAIQRALHAEAWPLPEPLGVRLALHTGEADLRDGDYYGTAPNRCARLRDAAHGGQAVLSSVTASLARERLPVGASLRSLGRHRLKDLPEPDEIFQVLHPELPAEFPPLRTLSSSPHNLPAQMTSFVGRGPELVDLRQQLLHKDVRLLTLTGAAGTGKTRLALQVAEDTLEEFPRGVFYVPLAPLSDPELLASTIGEAIGVREVPGQPLLHTLKDALQAQGLLLVLDNFEHVMQQAGQLGELLSACTSLKMLVTSREVLHLDAEHIFTVSALAVPDLDLRSRLSTEQLSRYDGIQLFVERARAAKPNVSITSQSVPVIAEICLRLDGLPLAIELAAARVSLMPPEALLERLSLTYDQRQTLLTGVGWNRPVRHQALHNAIDWSYGLLRPWEQRLFRRLAVFSRGFTMRAAEALCAADPELSQMVLDGVGSLIDKSLLQQAEDAVREPRYRMLQTIREYALVQLENAGELDLRYRDLAEFLVTLAEQAEPELTGPEQVTWLDRLEDEHDNLRAALQWCIETGTDHLALRLAGALWRFWSTRGYVGEGLRWLDAAIANTDAGASPHLARALNGAANLAREQGDYPRAERLHNQSLTILRDSGNQHGMAEALNNLGLIALYQGQHEVAQRYCEEGLALFREIGDNGGVAAALNNLGNVARERGESERSASLHRESLALRRAVGDKRGIALSLNNFANVVLNQGDYWRAAALHQESLALRRELRDRASVATSLNNLGNVARVQGDANAARAYYEESLAVRRELGDKRRVAAALVNLGIVEREQGNRDRSAALLRESLSLRRELGDQPGIEAALDNLRTLAMNQSDFAARVFFEETLAQRRDLDDRSGSVAALNNLGRVARAQGDFPAARSYYEESLSVRREMGDRRGTAITLNQLGELALLQEDFNRAVALLKQSLVLHQQLADKRGTAAALKNLATAARAQGDVVQARACYVESLGLYEQLGDRRNTTECCDRLAELADVDDAAFSSRTIA
ncbi:MAG TPA: tetratricopeptide repeat protein [Chloroflexota bacterium]|nr:tetratricopeptide repeat protein [Chloroflexota bacterium]